MRASRGGHRDEEVTVTVPTQSYRRQDRSLRLTFRFEGDQISLTERREVAMAAPPSEELGRKGAEDRSGFWLEVQDGQGRTLYRRTIRHPIRANAEIALEDGTFTNRVSVADRGAFSLVVPNLGPDAELALFASPVDRPHVPEPASEVLRVPLRDDRHRPREKRDEPDGPDQGGLKAE